MVDMLLEMYECILVGWGKAGGGVLESGLELLESAWSWLAMHDWPGRHSAALLTLPETGPAGQPAHLDTTRKASFPTQLGFFPSLIFGGLALAGARLKGGMDILSRRRVVLSCTCPLFNYNGPLADAKGPRGRVGRRRRAGAGWTGG